MARCPILPLALLLARHVASQQCYSGAGSKGPSNLVPCSGTGVSACCLLGDTCLSGSACFNYDTGNTYQYGCTDSNYKDSSCPYKCGLDTGQSPWIGLDICMAPGVTDTWICRASEKGNQSLFHLPTRTCEDLGTDALVALFAPSSLAPFASLPSSSGGRTSTLSPSTSYSAPRSKVLANPRATQTASTPTTSSSGMSVSAAGVQTTNVTPASITATTGSNGNIVTVTAPPSQSTTPGGESTGLSTGAKAGIGAGIGGGVVVIGALGAFFFLARRRKQKNRASTAPAPSWADGGSAQPEKSFAGSPDPQKDPPPSYAQDKNAGQPNELPGSDVQRQGYIPFRSVHELDSGTGYGGRY